MMHGFAGFHLTPEQIENLFPFYFVLDRSMNLAGVGRSLAKLDPALVPGRAFGDVMRLASVDGSPTFEAVQQRLRVLCVINLVSTEVVLRGQFKIVAEGSNLLFVGSPWLTNAAALEQLGLHLNDFAVHDPAIDLLHVMQAQSTSLSDARRLADILTRQRTELRDANTRLAAQEAESRKLAMIAARTDNAVILTDAIGRIEWVNEGFTRLTGFLPHEVIGRKPGECLQRAESDQAAVGRMRDRIREGLGFQERVLNFAKDGSPYWVLIDAEPIRNDAGEVVNFMAIERDVTQEHQAALQASRLNTLNEITRQIVESFLRDQNLSHSIDMILGRVGEFLDVSRAYLFRYRQGGQRLSNTHEWCAPGVLPQAHRLKELPGESFPFWTNVLARNEAIVLDDVAGQANDDVREMLGDQGVRALLVLPVIINNRLEAFFGFDDVRGVRHWRSEEVALLRTMVESLSRAIERRISERERLLAAVKIRDALARAESANELKSAFLANMSHELRTPMTAIMGFANLLRRDAGSARDRHAWSDSIARNADHLLALLNDLLDLSKIEAGQLTVVAESCDPAEVVADVIKQLRPLAAEKAIPLELVIDAASTITTTDRLRLRQIVLNLVSNAIRYTDSGSVRVRVTSVLSHRSEAIAIAVKDTGIGIPADKHDLLFIPFSQVHPDATRRGGGVGLGLNISRRLTELLGGTLTFSSAPGVGSEFVVTLPIVAASDPGAQANFPAVTRPPLTPSGVLSGNRILLVEDSADNRQLLTFLLAEAGASVVAAEDGQQACEICLDSAMASGQFDVVLMDMQMPVLDGYSATERLRRGGVDTPILALTAFAMADDRARCLRAGCDDYLSKPIDEVALLEKLAMWTRRSAEQRASDDIKQSGNKAASGNQPTQEPAPVAIPQDERAWLEAVIQDFRRTLPAVSDELTRAFESSNFLRMSQIAHRLRGVAATFRLPEIAFAAATFEDQFRTDEKSTQLRALGAALLTAVSRAIEIPD